MTGTPQLRHKFVGLHADAPDLDGLVGAAWDYQGPRHAGVAPQDDRVLAEWLVWCPLVSPVRAHWLVALLDLSASPAYAGASFALGATHELGVVGIVDDAPITVAEGLTIASPAELAYQFAASGNDAAVAFARAVVGRICAGSVFVEPGRIGGSGTYHGETLTLLLEEHDRAWHLTRGLRPGPVLKQAEYGQKLWHVTRSSLGGATLTPH